MLKRKIADYVKAKAESKAEEITQSVTNEVKSQYKFVLFMGKLYLYLGVAFAVSLIALVGFGIYSLVS
jgi:hypothetical protein